MVIKNIIAQIDSEIARLQQARDLLAGSKVAIAKGGRKEILAAVTAKPRKKRVLSAEARKRIADAQKKRWAAVHAKSKQ